jgi:hypothetical protein
VSGCQTGPAPADAEALARSIGADRDLEATAPVSVVVGGIPALRVDVVRADAVATAGCAEGQVPQVLMPPNDHDWYGVGLWSTGERMRLYLLDLPEGMPARTFAIAISAPEADLERVMEAVTPILESFEFHAR